MKATAWFMTTVFLLTGCASGSLYYHERSDGTRYYQTRTGQLVAVAKNGEVLEAPVMYGAGYKKQLQKKGDDWDLTGYDIVEPGSGFLACRDIGEGRLAEPSDILARVEATLARTKKKRR